MKPDSWTEAEWRIGSWLSAALDDPLVCKEMKDDIDAWFAELEERIHHGTN